MVDNGTESGPHSVTRSRTWMKWALGLSLGLNLLVVGLVAGAAYRFDGPHGGPGANRHDFGAPYIIALPEDRRRAIFKELRAGRQDKSTSRAARRALYAEAVAAIRAEPFDLARVTGVLDTQRDATIGVQQAAQSAWLAEIASMDAPARAAYADRLQEVLARGPKRDRKKEKQ